MSILIVGLMLVAALHTIGASKIAQSRSAEQVLGPMLAQELMIEILSQAYQEPVDTPVFGREGEPGGDRSLWDDVDDYHGWNASPPEYKNGTPVPGAEGYERTVSVTWANAFTPDNTTNSASDLKRIDVTVLHNGRTVAKLSALRSYVWPEDTQGQPAPLVVLFVVSNAGSLTAEESARKSLFEGWGHTVQLIDDGDPEADYDTAISTVDVAYVGPDISGAALTNKLTGKVIGIVDEFPGMLDNYGFCSTTNRTVNSNGFDLTDSQHYITQPFGGSAVTAFQVSYSLPRTRGTLAPDLMVVAETSGMQCLLALETGGERYDGDFAPARRVFLPYANADLSDLTDDGKTLMQRSIEWAAQREDLDGTSLPSNNNNSSSSFWENLFQ